jgi:hypothetical protein
MIAKVKKVAFGSSHQLLHLGEEDNVSEMSSLWRNPEKIRKILHSLW